MLWTMYLIYILNRNFFFLSANYCHKLNEKRHICWCYGWWLDWSFSMIMFIPWEHLSVDHTSMWRVAFACCKLNQPSKLNHFWMLYDTRPNIWTKKIHLKTFEIYWPHKLNNLALPPHIYTYLHPHNYLYLSQIELISLFFMFTFNHSHSLTHIRDKQTDHT